MVVFVLIVFLKRRKVNVEEEFCVEFLKFEDDFCRKLLLFVFFFLIMYVYNLFEYVREIYEDYVKKYCKVG